MSTVKKATLTSGVTGQKRNGNKVMRNCLKSMTEKLLKCNKWEGYIQ